MFERFLKKTLVSVLPAVKGRYFENITMAKHTWFGVGGPAEVLFLPKDADDLSLFLKNKPSYVPVTLLGRGSNVLVRDGGIKGVVIKLESPFFKQVILDEGKITCFAGVQNMNLKKVLLNNQTGGLEFLCSIPGTLGGAIRTNAGCFGKMISDVLLSACVMDKDGNIKTVFPEDFHFEYRGSLFPSDWIILSVTLKTEVKSAEEIKKTLEEQRKYRVENQPYNAKTAGSTFKNPIGLKAWELIKNAGCENLQIGGAKVSDKHCNFLINTGSATAEDIENLGNEIIKRVKAKTYVTLEWEVKRMGVKG